MSTPRVTVVMAVHNADKYIGQAINSLVNQTLSDFELIVVDDASTDSSRELVRSNSDPRIQFIENSGQMGVSYSRNRALKQARAEYVAILDADDIALPDRLQLQARYLDAHPDVFLVGSNHETINEVGDVTSRDNNRRDPLKLRWLLLFGNCFVHSTVMFRRSGIQEWGGYDERMPSGEDYDLYTRFAAKSTVAQLDEVLVQWRCHSESLSHRQTIESHRPIWAQSMSRGIYSQTGKAINDDVASCLLRNFARPTMNPETVLQAYQVINDCFESLEKSHSSKTDCRSLLFLATEEMFRIAKLNLTWVPYAFRRALRLTLIKDPRAVLSAGFAKAICKPLVPSRVATALDRWKRLGRGSFESDRLSAQQEIFVVPPSPN